MLSILYLTDNSLREDIYKFCQNHLSSESWFNEIITVSQKPIPGKNNICVGNIGRSWLSLYTQILGGLDKVETEYVGIAEHDCLMIPGHWEFIPPDDKFYYNKNHWLVDWDTGEYFYIKKRKALSQLICRTRLLYKAISEIYDLLLAGLPTDPGLRWYGEPGHSIKRYDEYIRRSGINGELKRKFLEWISKYESEYFETEYPNLDIRHDSNFTGKKKGKNNCYEIPYWGKFKNL